MHPAASFRPEGREALLAHLASHPFVAVFAVTEAGPRVAHSPAVVRTGGGGLALDFHLSRSNALTATFAAGAPALAVSQGPDAYVSPDWYELADQVPTWNYVAVEAEGDVSPLDEAGLVALLDDLSAQEEARLAPKPPWTRGKMSPGRFEAMLRGIQGFRLQVRRLEGTFKLSQNKPPGERARVAEALAARPIARLMGHGASD